MKAGPAAGLELVGREDEERTLADARRRAAQGHGAFALVSGDAGIGKTRLVATLNDSFASGRALCATALGREFGCTPYGPIYEVLGAIGAGVPATGARDRAEHLSKLHESLAQTCARRFVAIVLEDIHWADDGTLKFLAHVLPSVASMRLLIVATYRTDEVDTESPLAAHVARYVRDPACIRIGLGPLTAPEIRRLIAAAQSPNARLARVVLDDIAQRSEGNPFFAQELLRSALERHDRAGATGDLPMNIAALVGERLALLTPASRRLLTFASVIGRRFDAAFLAELAGASPDDVVDALRAARDARLIDDRRDGGYAFRHALTREAVYSRMLVEETRPLHARILRALEQHERASVHDLSYHAWAAGALAECLRYGERAGDDADALHAYADAARAYERALSGAQSHEARGRLLAKAAGSVSRDGDSPRAAELFEAAASAMELAGDRVRALDHYQAMSAQARVGGDNDRAMLILERARGLIGERDEPFVHARLSIALAVLYLDRGHAQRANDLLETSAALADSVVFQNARGYAAAVAGDLETIRDVATVSAAFGAERAPAARFNFAFSLGAIGQDTEALELFETMLPELRERRLSSLEVLACANYAMILARRGRPEEARTVVERGLAIPEPATTGPVALASAALIVARLLGDEALVARAVTPAVVEAAFSSRINSTLGRFAGPYARWLALQGRREEAAAMLRRAVAGLAGPFAATDTLLAAMELGDSATQRRAGGFLAQLDALAHLEIYAATALYVRALQAAGECPSGVSDLAAGAARAYTTLGWATYEAQCLELAGETREAAALWKRMGATGELQRMHRSAGPGSPLSAREREIAALIADGTPNRVLAERFAINQRTVEKHLTSIYAKLGLRNRSELAAFVAREAAR